MELVAFLFLVALVVLVAATWRDAWQRVQPCHHGRLARMRNARRETQRTINHISEGFRRSDAGSGRR